MTPDRIAVLTPLAYRPGHLSLFVARAGRAADFREQIARANGVLSDYRALLERSRSQPAADSTARCWPVALLIVALAIFIALKLADRLVRPVGELVDAARRVDGGRSFARGSRSSARRRRDRTLGNAFNRMTGRLEEQTGALVAANAQLDSRRAFIEAVLSSVTAGVISVDDEHVVRLINRSAEALLKTGEQEPR